MPLRLPDKWVWDFWLARDGDDHHIFYLQAPRSLGRSDLRHRNASIGHAVSTDLREWTILPDALGPGRPGSWDDLATWTGSVIERAGHWHMLYTGISTADSGLIQRVGLATSDDLVHWTKHPANPVLEADGRWYELLDLTRWRDQSWRDPWLYIEPGDAGVHVLLTARSPQGSADGAGVVAHARSDDLVHWEVRAPVTQPGEFAQVECPQLVHVDGRRLILFSCLDEDHSTTRRERIGKGGSTGTFVFSDVDGEFLPSGRPIAPADSTAGPLYAGKVVEVGPGDWRFIGFRGAGDRDFVGELSDPIPVQFNEHGELGVVAEPTPPDQSKLDVTLT
jgi:beta-fructofuranosidase